MVIGEIRARLMTVSKGKILLQEPGGQAVLGQEHTPAISIDELCEPYRGRQQRQRMTKIKQAGDKAYPDKRSI
jgi:hypothetical protein